jgi:hypothetical protein
MLKNAANDAAEEMVFSVRSSGRQWLIRSTKHAVR